MEVWKSEVRPTLDEFVARTTWEEVCVQHLWRRLAAGQLAVPLARLGPWWDGKDEIDLVGLWQNEVTLVGECKWTATPVEESVLALLQRKAEKLPTAQQLLWVLASRSGCSPALRRRAERGDLLLLEPAGLFS